MSAFYILLLAFGDRIRGSAWFRFNHFTGMLIMNVGAIGLLHPHGWWIAYAMLAPCIGYSFGLNPSLANEYSKQVLSPQVLLRAVLWGLPWVLISPYAPIPFALAFIITPIPFGILQRKYGQWRKFGMDWWGCMELTRGLLSGIGLYLVN